MSHLVQGGDAGEVDHGRRPAHERDDVIAGREQVFADHVLVDKAGAVFPA